MQKSSPNNRFAQVVHRAISRVARFGVLAALLTGAALSAGSAVAQEQDGCVGKPSDTRAYVTINNVRSTDGVVTITLYPDVSDRFLKRKGSLYVRRVPAVSPTTRICFLIPEPGIYGLVVYHDENANNKIDRPGLLPTEGFGFSNNAPTFFGLPSFSDVRIKLAADAETEITLRYLTEDELKRAPN